MEKETVVLYTSVGVGHLGPMTELAKLLLHHGFSPIIVFLELSNANNSAVSSFISKLSSSNPSIAFHVIPSPDLPPPQDEEKRSIKFFSLLAAGNLYLLDFVRSIRHPVRALVTDFFCVCAIDVARELGVRSYVFFTSSVSSLASFLYLGSHRSEFRKPVVNVPGLPPIPASHLPDPFREGDDVLEAMADCFSRFIDFDGILVNSFSVLESAALEAVVSGLCVDSGRRMNPVHCIGPIIAEPVVGVKPHECLTWLDSQPEKSVVFLSFGSMGALSAEQLREIAVGLERSGQRFIWVVRSPVDKDEKQVFGPVPEPDLAALLPEGFVERTVDRGMVVKSWAPQVEVLRHVSTGGFVTHCGWNSTLEALAAGVPMIGWPLYAEQRSNLLVLSQQLKLATAMNGYDEDIVSAAEVEERVTWLMASEGGRELRKRTEEAKLAAAAAVQEGGCSYEALSAVVGSWN